MCVSVSVRGVRVCGVLWREVACVRRECVHSNTRAACMPCLRYAYLSVKFLNVSTRYLLLRWPLHSTSIKLIYSDRVSLWPIFQPRDKRLLAILEVTTLRTHYWQSLKLPHSVHTTAHTAPTRTDSFVCVFFLFVSLFVNAQSAPT